MKIIRISGGLGNQLFQYAFARALEERTADDVFLDVSTYGYEAAHNGFELDRLFAARFRTADEKDIARLGTRPKGFASQLRRKYFTKRSHRIDRVFRYDPEVFLLEGDRYFEGWWQTERYFLPCAARIRGELRFIADPGSHNEALISQFEEGRGNLFGKTPVSIHVRRGDALRNPDTYVCTEAYYRNALEYVRERIDPHFLVFSDDIAWCRAHLGLRAEEATFVDWNRGAESWRDLWLMSHCSAHIIANSTFSWWGAWLDPATDKLVVAPERWSLAKLKPLAYYRYTFDDVVPEAWIRVPIE